jgi:hypothetical protein
MVIDMKYTTIIAAAALALTACRADPEASGRSSNRDVEVVKIADVQANGCQIFRFADDFSAYKYFVTCPGGGAVTTSGTESCGKNCVRNVSVQTLPVDARVSR